MNELIKELADSLWRVHPADIDAMGLKTRTEFYEHELKKFAELIVKECLGDLKERIALRYQGDQKDRDIAYGMEIVYLDIVDNFGIEE
jgi:hypothetical protein